VILTSALTGANTNLLAELALTQKLPAITLFSDFARNGGLMAYGPNLLAQFRLAGVMAAKILNGTKPAVLPIESPTRFEFVLNLKPQASLDLPFRLLCCYAPTRSSNNDHFFLRRMSSLLAQSGHC